MSTCKTMTQPAAEACWYFDVCYRLFVPASLLGFVRNCRVVLEISPVGGVVSLQEQQQPRLHSESEQLAPALREAPVCAPSSALTVSPWHRGSVRLTEGSGTSRVTNDPQFYLTSPERRTTIASIAMC